MKMHWHIFMQRRKYFKSKEPKNRKYDLKIIIMNLYLYLIARLPKVALKIDEIIN